MSTIVLWIFLVECVVLLGLRLWNLSVAAYPRTEQLTRKDDVLFAVTYLLVAITFLLALVNPARVPPAVTVVHILHP